MTKKEDLEDKVIVVPAKELFSLLDAAFGVFEAVDGFWEVFDKFVKTEMQTGPFDEDEQDTHDNVIELEARRLDKKQSDLEFPEGER